MIKELMNSYSTKFKLKQKVKFKYSDEDIIGVIDRIQLMPSEFDKYTVTYNVVWFNNGSRHDIWCYKYELEEVK